MRALLIALAVVVPLAAQEASAPALDAVDQKLLAVVRDSARLADKACQALPEMKLYNDTRAAVQGTLEAKYPGQTVDWSTGRLKPTGAK